MSPSPGTRPLRSRPRTHSMAVEPAGRAPLAGAPPPAPGTGARNRAAPLGAAPRRRAEPAGRAGGPAGARVPGGAREGVASAEKGDPVQVVGEGGIGRRRPPEELPAAS